MRHPFPFELPAATAFYVLLYLLTFVLHIVFMHYVVAGTLYVLWSAMLPNRPGATPRTDEMLAATLRDWLPFVLSAAITAGVAPLLFMQVLYRYQFYSANLLLGWRWMLIIPALIIGFYLLYLLKTRLAVEGAWWLRFSIAGGAVVCFLLIGVGWSTNHLLAMRADEWPQVYISGRLPITAKTLLPRIGLWLGGSFATMAALVGWQLLAKTQRAGNAERADWEGVETRRLTILAWTSVAVAVSSAMIAMLLVPGVRHATMSLQGIAYTMAAFCGAIVQMIGWWSQRRKRHLHVNGMTLVTIGVLFSLMGTAAVREIHRLNAIGLSRSLVAAHKRAAQIDGFELFLIFAVINVGLVAYCVWLVNRSASGEANHS